MRGFILFRAGSGEREAKSISREQSVAAMKGAALDARIQVLDRLAIDPEKPDEVREFNRVRQFDFVKEMRCFACDFSEIRLCVSFDLDRGEQACKEVRTREIRSSGLYSLR